MLTPLLGSSQEIKQPQFINNLYCWDSTDVINIGNKIAKQDAIIVGLSVALDTTYREHNKLKVDYILLNENNTILKDQNKELYKNYDREVKRHPLYVLAGFAGGFIVGRLTKK